MVDWELLVSDRQGLMNAPELTVVDRGVLKQMARWWLFSFSLCSWAQNGSHTFYDALSCHRPKAKSIHLKLEPLKSLLMFYYNFIFTDVLL